MKFIRDIINEKKQAAAMSGMPDPMMSDIDPIERMRPQAETPQPTEPQADDPFVLEDKHAFEQSAPDQDAEDLSILLSDDFAQDLMQTNDDTEFDLLTDTDADPAGDAESLFQPDEEAEVAQMAVPEPEPAPQAMRHTTSEMIDIPMPTPAPVQAQAQAQAPAPEQNAVPEPTAEVRVQPAAEPAPQPLKVAAERPAPVPMPEQTEAPAAVSPLRASARQAQPQPHELRAALEPVVDAQQTVEVPAPSAGRASRRAGRVKTRLLGFTGGQGGANDPFAAEAESDEAAPVKFPVGWLAVVEGPGRGATFSLFSGVSQIGRGEGQAVRLDFGDTSISRASHAAVAYDPEQRAFFLGHGGKANLVRLNNRPVLSTEDLQNGDVIRIGETTLRFIGLCGTDFDWNEGQEEERGHASFG